MISRRGLMIGSLGLGLAGAASRAAALTPASDDSTRLILLGTKGGPAIRAHAALPSSNVLLIRGVPYLIDAGYGATYRLVEAGISLPKLRYLFLTHHHSDHNLEFGTVLYNAWAIGLKSRVDAYGPAGIEALANGFWEANRFDIETRIEDEGRPDLRELVVLHTYGEGIGMPVEICAGASAVPACAATPQPQAWPVMENEAVRVTALRNHHPPIAQSYALKFEIDGKVVVFSGDTSYFPPLAAFAYNADYLIHEVMYGPGIERLVSRNPNAARLLEHLKAAHTLAPDVGRIAAEAQVKTLVLNHFVPADDPSISDQDWVAGVREHFAGRIIVGKDLMEIPIG